MSARIVHIASNTFREAVRDRVVHFSEPMVLPYPSAADPKRNPHRTAPATAPNAAPAVEHLLL